MKPVILGSCLVLVLAGSAGAGPCTTEIETMSKMLASRDAGAGPTGSTTASGGQHPPTATMGQADPSTTASRSSTQSATPQQPPTAAMTREATGAQPPSPDRPGATQQQPPTAAMGSATYGTAASPQDVQRQTEGRPTAAQQAQGQLPQTGSDHQAAFAALAQARAFDAQGKEADCMQAIGQARQHAR